MLPFLFKKFSWTALVLLLALNTGIYFNIKPDIQPEATLQHVTVVVSNFEQSKTFYTEILGLTEITAPWLPEKQMFLQFGRNLELHVGEVPGVEIKPSAFNHFAFSVSDFDGFLKHLKENEIVYGNLQGDQDYHIQTRDDGVRQTFFRDPDGYRIEVNDYRAQ